MADDNEKGAQTPAPPAQQDGATTAKAKKAATPEPEKRIDETVPGGRYIVGDKVVDATGKVLGDA